MHTKTQKPQRATPKTQQQQRDSRRADEAREAAQVDDVSAFRHVQVSRRRVQKLEADRAVAVCRGCNLEAYFWGKEHTHTLHQHIDRPAAPPPTHSWRSLCTGKQK
jgi:hypothetical protein